MKPFTLNIASKNNSLFSQLVIKLITFTDYGAITILANHSPIITKISSYGFLYQNIQKKKYIVYLQKNGIIDFYKNNLIVLTDFYHIINNKKEDIINDNKKNIKGLINLFKLYI